MEVFNTYKNESISCYFVFSLIKQYIVWIMTAFLNVKYIYADHDIMSLANIQTKQH